MSKTFFDHLLDLTEIEDELKKLDIESGEKEELWSLIDEIIHHKVLGCIFDHLPHPDHQEFLEKVHESPHEEDLFTYLNDKAGKNMEEIIRQEIGNLTYELVRDIKSSHAE